MNSTRLKGQSRATVVAKTIHGGNPIISWELEFPRYITPEILRHRSFSFCQQSSRATPTQVLVERIQENPAFFDELGINRPGMTAAEVMDPKMAREFELDWMGLTSAACRFALKWSEKGAHKQIVNRALEPFMKTKMLVTATATREFFNQRRSILAQPEMRNLADAMWESTYATEAERCEHHIPYGDKFEETSPQLRIIRGIAASARVCVGRHDGTPSTLAEDWRLVKRLYDNNRRSPFEHVAEGFHGRFANFYGWMSLRYVMEEMPSQLERLLLEAKPDDA